MRLKRILVLGASMVALSLVITSCGSTGGPSSSAKATVRIASFNFSESIILAHIYGDALRNKGYTITYRDKLGNREIVEPSLENGLIDLYAGYAATDLNFVDKRQSADLEAGTDAAANVQKINTRLASKGVKALDPSPAVDQNAFAITKAEADQFHLTKLSDVTPANVRLEVQVVQVARHRRASDVRRAEARFHQYRPRLLQRRRHHGEQLRRPRGRQASA